MTDLPTGTVTFLFTDLEGSTRLWEQHPDAMRDALARHDEILRSAVETRDGHVIKTTGDGLMAVFPVAAGGVHAAVDAQRALVEEQWALPEPLRVRMGLHTGSAEIRDGDYFGTAVDRAARISAAADGGQIICSHATADLTSDGLDPDLVVSDLGEHRLRDLGRPERMYQISAPLLAGTFPPLRTMTDETNLPVQLTSFVGREVAIAEVVDALSEARIVTLTGVGGVGKTRLALQVAAELLPRFEAGAWLVELAAVSEPDGVADAISTALGVTNVTGSSVEEAIREHVRRRSMLLVLDNCEHLLDRVARITATITRESPGVVVLATSREGLALPGERMYAVAALGLPADDRSPETIAEADAVRLFVDRARAVRNDFALTADNAAAVAAVCRRLDGVPLALELAAARITSLTPSQIADRLDERFRLLTAGRRGAVERHQTLRATIDWSYDLLASHEQLALQRLSVFAGGCTLDAAEPVLAGGDIEDFAVVDLLGRLVDQSLVVATDDGSVRRYRLLETVRQYAAEQLAAGGDTEATLARHAQYFRTLASQVGAGVRGPDELQWMAAYQASLDDLRNALAWLVECDQVDDALGAVVDLYALSFTESTQSIAELAAVASSAASARDHPLGPAVATVAGERLVHLGDVEAGLDAIAEAREQQSQLDGLPHPLMLFVQFRMGMMLGDWDVCIRSLDAMIEHPIVRHDGFTYAWALNAVGAVRILTGDTEAGFDALHEALDAVEVGNPSELGMIAGSLGWALRDREPEVAQGLIDEVLVLSVLSPSLSTSLAYGNRAILHARAARVSDALADGRAAHERLERDRERNTTSGAVAHLSIALAELGRSEGAATLFGFACTVSPIASNPAYGWDGVAGRVRDDLGHEAYDRAIAAGGALDRDGALGRLATELDAVEAELADA